MSVRIFIAGVLVLKRDKHKKFNANSVKKKTHILMATTCMSSLLLLSCTENNDVQYLTGNINFYSMTFCDCNNGFRPHSLVSDYIFIDGSVTGI